MPTVENTTARIRQFYISEIESIVLYPGYNIITDKQKDKFIQHPSVQVAYDCGELKDVIIEESKIEKSLDGLDILHNSDGEPVPVRGFSDDPLYTDEEALRKSEEYLDTLAENEEPQQTTVRGVSDDIVQHIRVDGALLKKLGYSRDSATKIIKSQPTDGYTRESLSSVLSKLEDKIEVSAFFEE
jgi:hypothetical protein